VVVGQTSSHGAAPDTGGDFDVAAARAEAAALLSAKDTLEGGEGEDSPDNPAEAPAPAEAKPPAEGDADELTKNWVRLRDQERRFKVRMERERAEDAKAKTAWQSEKEAILKEVEPLKAAKARAAKEPLSALRELGWEFPELVDYVQKNGQIPQERILKDLQMSMDEKMAAQQARLDEMDAREKEMTRGQRINTFQQAVVDEVRTTIEGFPNLNKFLAKHGPQKVMPKIFWKMETEAKVKNYLTPAQVMGMFEDELSQVAALYESPSPALGGAGSGPANPEAVKPRTRPELVSNDDESERGHRDVDDDDEDMESRRRRARALLAG
jgi:hypothetical protein